MLFSHLPALIFLVYGTVIFMKVKKPEKHADQGCPPEKGFPKALSDSTGLHLLPVSAFPAPALSHRLPLFGTASIYCRSLLPIIHDFDVLLSLLVYFT